MISSDNIKHENTKENEPSSFGSGFTLDYQYLEDEIQNGRYKLFDTSKEELDSFFEKEYSKWQYITFTRSTVVKQPEEYLDLTFSILDNNGNELITDVISYLRISHNYGESYGIEDMDLYSYEWVLRTKNPLINRYIQKFPLYLNVDFPNDDYVICKIDEK